MIQQELSTRKHQKKEIQIQCKKNAVMKNCDDVWSKEELRTIPINKRNKNLQMYKEMNA